MTPLFGAITASLALVGLCTVVRALCRGVAGAARAVDRQLARMAGFVASRWRAYAFARERRKRQDRDGISALQQTTIATTVELLAELQRKITSLEAQLNKTP